MAFLWIGVKDRAEPIEVPEYGESTIEHHPAQPTGVTKLDSAPFSKQDMHYALDHPVELAGFEKHTQLQLRMAKNAAEQYGEAQTRFAVGKGRRSSLLEDGVRLRAKRPASSVKLIERRANCSEPGDVDDLDQTRAGDV